MNLCKSCRAEIFWAYTVNDKRIPLDCQTYLDGNIYVVGDRAVTLSQSSCPPAGTPLYKSHFATCPNSKHHRKKTRRE